MRGSVAWITIAPVKALGLVQRDDVLLERSGVRENRRFYLVDDEGRMVNGKTMGPLVRVLPDYDEAAGTLALRLPDGATVAAEVALGEHLTTSFFGRPVAGRLVEGPWSGVLSEIASRPLRLVQTERLGDGADRGSGAGVSLVGTASLEALAEAAGVGHVDGRRFRMLFGVDGVPAHAEDEWVGRDVRIGEALVRPRGNVGRCAVTTQNPETGVPDLDTLRVLGEYRGEVETTERLPFGVWGMVLEPGRVRLGDPVQPE
ncbi:MAG TPA: MOSC N-terminal beta barrel domain-containing protein [Gaiellaceae bacterium]|nr:MOSC N-terminal beta barrel domain-containing protein [Gaiellaceae bacterium]